MWASAPTKGTGDGAAGTPPPTEGTEDAECRVGLRPPRNDRGFLSFRGAKRRGNPFLSQQGSVPHTVAEVLWFPQRAATTQAALSEAGSADRGTGQFGFCPIIEPCSTAHNVRRLDWHPARGYAGASPQLSRTVTTRIPPGGRALRARLPGDKAFFLLTAPPPFSFCRRKKKMGVESRRGSPAPPVGQPAIGGAAGTPPPTKLVQGCEHRSACWQSLSHDRRP